MLKSRFLLLNVKDFIKGLIVAILTGILTFLTAELQTGAEINVDLFKRTGLAALIAFIAYLLKNLFTNNNDQFLKTD